MPGNGAIGGALDGEKTSSTRRELLRFLTPFPWFTEFSHGRAFDLLPHRSRYTNSKLHKNY